MWYRRFAVLSLFFLTPLIAEFLLGNLPVSMIALILPLALMYGSGAVLIREVVRRTGRGWPSLILLATAYGLIEEGLVTQSLFNPNYLHLRLLDYGFIPTFGTGLPWLLYVISLHVIWSISVPIALTEALFPSMSNTPWLGNIGLAVIGLLFVGGLVLLAFFTYREYPYLASPAQFTTVGVSVVALCITAFLVPKGGQPSSGKAPQPLVLFLTAFIMGSFLMGLQLFADQGWHWPWLATLAAALALEVLFMAFLVRFTRNRTWDSRQRFALMAGGLSVYLWFGFVLDYFTHGAAEMLGHAVVVLFVVVLALVAGVQAFKAKSPAEGVLGH